MTSGFNVADKIKALSDCALVLGNGPSLKGVHLPDLAGITTIGMNAAYRFWDRIGWYPTHYCCLDDELIATHHQHICRLVREGLVETAFATGSLLELHPELIEDPRFVFLDSFQPYWHATRGEGLGLARVDHPAFTSSSPSKITTGAYAVRYAIWLGFRRIYLHGIDCKYVEVIDGADRSDGHALRMGQTPSNNPNYFFDDYQIKGDRYNVPNPPQHGGNLHLQALEAVRDDIVSGGIAVEVSNCSSSSALSEEGVFPFVSLDRALQLNQLGAVAVPLTDHEEEMLLENFRRWNEPRHIPAFPSDKPAEVSLVVVFNGRRDPVREDRIRAVFDGLENLRRCFSSLHFQYCELRPEEDYYERDYSKTVGPAGFKAGPNAQFFGAMRQLATYGHYVFMMETDCLPVRPGWVSALQRIINSSNDFWIMGSMYRGVGTLDRPYHIHLNGNSVYAVGDPRFQQFLDEVWEPALVNLVAQMPTLAYDCVLPTYFAMQEDEAGWRTQQDVMHNFVYTDYIQNHAGRLEVEGAAGRALGDILRESPETYVVHGRHFFNEPRPLPLD